MNARSFPASRTPATHQMKPWERASERSWYPRPKIPTLPVAMKQALPMTQVMNPPQQGRNQGGTEAWPLSRSLNDRVARWKTTPASEAMRATSG